MFILTVIMYADCLPVEQALSVPVNSVHVAQQQQKKSPGLSYIMASSFVLY